MENKKRCNVIQNSLHLNKRIFCDLPWEIYFWSHELFRRTNNYEIGAVCIGLLQTLTVPLRSVSATNSNSITIIVFMYIVLFSFFNDTLPSNPLMLSSMWPMLPTLWGSRKTFMWPEKYLRHHLSHYFLIFFVLVFFLSCLSPSVCAVFSSQWFNWGAATITCQLIPSNMNEFSRLLKPQDLSTIPGSSVYSARPDLLWRGLDEKKSI